MDPLEQENPLWGRIKDAAHTILGQSQIDVSWGGGQPTSGRITVGEDRVMSAGALVAVGVGGVLVGAFLFGRR